MSRGGSRPNAGRPKGSTNDGPMSEAWRKKISIGRITQRLSDHVAGNNQMTSTQIKAAEILLRKTVPDLARHQHSGDADNPVETVVRWASEKP